MAAVEQAVPAAANGAKEPETIKEVEEKAPTSRIQVSNTKKPLYFYVNLSKRLLQEHGEVQLSGLGLAVQSVVNVAEILKGMDLVEMKKITTSLETLTDDGKTRITPKPKLQVLLFKSAEFDSIMAKQAELAKQAAGET
eukprot:TRINITY_DN246_c0_g1_i1.p4 TRINITY_DN246_c0_g1~~TRINITY_DN246_c0_g1_i1.p4  ORF type:complete len:139 (-),score=35.42 TRINITY_DN246_c0_g1_i1:434-850(-)